MEFDKAVLLYSVVYLFQAFPLSYSWLLLKYAEIYLNTGDFSIPQAKNFQSFSAKHFSPRYMQFGHFWQKKKFEFSSLEKNFQVKNFQSFSKNYISPCFKQFKSFLANKKFLIFLVIS